MQIFLRVFTLKIILQSKILCRKEAPTLKNLLKGKQLDAHIYMERIPVEQIPNDQKECDKWMYEVFEKKVTIIITS